MINPKIFITLIQTLVPKMDTMKLLIVFIAIITLVILYHQCNPTIISDKPPRDSIVMVDSLRIIHDTVKVYKVKQIPDIVYITDIFTNPYLTWGKNIKIRWTKPNVIYNDTSYTTNIPIDYVYQFKMWKDSLNISYFDSTTLLSKNFYLNFSKYKYYQWKQGNLYGVDKATSENPISQISKKLKIEGNFLLGYSPWGNSFVGVETLLHIPQVKLFVSSNYFLNANPNFNIHIGLKYNFFQTK